MRATVTPELEELHTELIAQAADNYIHFVFAKDKEQTLRWGRQLVVLSMINSQVDEPWFIVARQQLLYAAYGDNMMENLVWNTNFFSEDKEKLRSMARSSTSKIVPAGSYTAEEFIYGLITGKLNFKPVQADISETAA